MSKGLKMPDQSPRSLPVEGQPCADQPAGKPQPVHEIARSDLVEAPAETQDLWGILPFDPDRKPEEIIREAWGSH